MAIATNVSTTLIKVLPLGTVTTYTNVSAYITNSLGVITRYDCVVINSSLSVDGSITASGVIFPTAGNYRCVLSTESNADLDVNGTVVTPIFTTLVSVVAPLDTTVYF